MKVLSLRPYPGTIIVCRKRDVMAKLYKRYCREPYPYKDEVRGGRFVRIERGGTEAETIWLVYAVQPHVLAHELSHVLFRVFETIGSNPSEGNQEPFCYMLSQLMLEAK